MRKVFFILLLLLCSCERYTYETFTQEETIVSKYSEVVMETYPVSDYVYDYHYDPLSGEYAYGPHYVTRYETRPETRYKVLTETHSFAVNSDVFYRAEKGGVAVVRYKKVFKEIDEVPVYQETQVDGISYIKP